jgi:hypothetical protein
VFVRQEAHVAERLGQAALAEKEKNIADKAHNFMGTPHKFEVPIPTLRKDIVI